METSLKNFKDKYLELMLNFLWRQWSQLGVFGEVAHEDNWVIDPEALLLITLEFARYEARVFDEVVDWLVINGKWLNVQRLNNIAKLDERYDRSVLYAVAETLAAHDKSAKWKRVSRHFEANSSHKIGATASQPLFYLKDGSPHPIPHKTDEIFKKYGYLRPPINPRKLSRGIQAHASSNLWFKLRALFGVNLRADIIAYLITHDSAHPRRVARDIVFSQPRVQTTMVELTLTGLIWIKHRKREKDYWLNRYDWWSFVNPQMLQREIPRWVNWTFLFRGLSLIWRRLSKLNLESLSQYLQQSELRQLMEEARNDLEQSGLTTTYPLPTEPYKVEDYVGVVMESIRRILG